MNVKKILLAVLLLSSVCFAANNKNDKFNLNIHVTSSTQIGRAHV